MIEIGRLGIGLLGGAIASPIYQSNVDRQSSADGQFDADRQVAQNSDIGCRQTNAITGVYEQPNLDSASRGILPLAQTVRIEVLGTGTGWARINQPVVGWIQARYLTPDASCGDLGVATPQNPVLSNTATSGSAQAPNRSFGQPGSSSQPRQRQPRQQEASSFPSPDLSSLRSNRAGNGRSTPEIRSPNAAQAPDTQVTTLTCDVLPTEELMVRREPIVAADTFITTIPIGTYQFQFTRTTRTVETPQGIQRWVYITAPVEGWISLGYVGKDFNLGGRECG
ncbi:MAG: hypothetical protein KME15_04600 [Drouetiella hepatica Uher 2000/2452]|uniref:SH3b domain-containing protein n=1 Tax=Drouetiella hepatica Uher 2000/2452 TaxID=904376 RepID=A0A951Q9T7_9CYAN|nr:hypothetical protein [Drouetiella hepatica Uher 2000/2452]